MSWLVANEFSKNGDVKNITSKLCQAHTAMLKEDPEKDLFEPSISQFLVKILIPHQQQKLTDKATDKATDKQVNKKEKYVKDSRDYLEQLCRVKLFDQKTYLKDTIDRIDLGNLVLDVVQQLDASAQAVFNATFLEHLHSSLFHG